MASLNFAERVIELSIAYFGPPNAGCGTNVRHLHRTAPAREKAELRRQGPSERKERMWSFAYHPADPPRIPGFDVRIRVCSVPGGTDLQLDRDAVLAGVDGIVFVADARAGRSDENLAALLDLEQLLARQGQDLGGLPMIFQVNQADAQSARPAERVVEELNPFGLPVLEACARQGRGVLETHDAIVQAVFARLREQLQGGDLQVTVTAVSRAARERTEDALAAHAVVLPQAARPLPPTLGLAATAEIPVRLAELKGNRPVQHVRTEVQGDRVRVEGVFRRADGSHRKLALLLEPSGEASEEPRTTPRHDTGPTPLDRLAPPPPPPEELGELSRLFYGITGLVGGFISGILFYYVRFG